MIKRKEENLGTRRIRGIQYLGGNLRALYHPADRVKRLGQHGRSNEVPDRVLVNIQVRAIIINKA